MADSKKAIIKAAKAGRLEEVKALVGADASLIHVCDSDGSTALHCATWKGHQAVVAYLLSVGADANAPITMSIGERPHFTPRLTLIKR